ncbi:MAG TPA: response regulator transcription factor [Longimicrobium sp.]|nr:response regulator transcription factor [Longimicrobium sp.]
MTRVLVVEDDPDLAFGLRTTLEIEGYTADVAADGLQGLQRAREDRPDLVILDLMLPGMDGYRVLRTLRAEGNRVPVLILTARGEEADKVLGFRSGADDYVTKPFGLLELLARVEALLRRAGGGVAEAPPVDHFGEVEMDRAARTVTRRGEAVSLAPREFDLLLALYDRNGGVISRQDLLREVWGHRGAVLTRTVDIHVAELRRKLEDDPAEPRHILTVWKKGYRLKR